MFHIEIEDFKIYIQIQSLRIKIEDFKINPINPFIPISTNKGSENVNLLLKLSYNTP